MISWSNRAKISTPFFLLLLFVVFIFVSAFSFVFFFSSLWLPRGEFTFVRLLFFLLSFDLLFIFRFSTASPGLYKLRVYSVGQKYRESSEISVRTKSRISPSENNGKLFCERAFGGDESSFVFVFWFYSYDFFCARYVILKMEVRCDFLTLLNRVLGLRK